METTLHPSHLFGQKKFPFKRLMVIRNPKSLLTKNLCGNILLSLRNDHLTKAEGKKATLIGSETPQLPMFSGDQKKPQRARMQCLVTVGSTNGCTKNFVLL